MAAHKIRCFDPKCKGVPHSVPNNGASRLGAYFGREVYQCDVCGTQWNVDTAWYNDKLKPVSKC